MNTAWLDHFDHPRGAGGLPAGPGTVRTGAAGSEHHGAVIRFDLKTGRDGRIEYLAFKAWGCSATIACASLVAEWGPGKTLDEARTLDVRALAGVFQLPPERMVAPLLVEDALRAAVQEE